MNAFEALAKNSTESIYNCFGSEASYAIGGNRNNSGSRERSLAINVHTILS